MSSALLAYDEGAGAGLGHRRRIESLAAALRDLGWDVQTQALGAAPLQADVVVLDSYRVRADDRAAVQGNIVIAVDDLGRDLAVDVVIDPSPGSGAELHTKARAVLAGASYALVPRPLPAAPAAAAAGPVSRVLVTTGAADSRGIGAALAMAVRAAVADVEIRLVVGPWGNALVPAGVVAVTAPDGLADELAAAPVVVTAGGVALLEACLLARAIVAVAIADNQRQAISGLQDAGALVRANAGTVGREVASLIGDPARRRALAAAAEHALDGLGPKRCAQAIAEIVAVPESV